MSLRDWLILTGVVVLVGILADGIRRVRKRNKIRLNIDKNLKDLPEVDLSGELPNGGARPAQSSNRVVKPAVPKFSYQKPAVDAGDDIDLLMAAEFKGVGAGADHCLDASSSMPQSVVVSSTDEGTFDEPASETHSIDTKLKVDFDSIPTLTDSIQPAPVAESATASADPTSEPLEAHPLAKQSLDATTETVVAESDFDDEDGIVSKPRKANAEAVTAQMRTETVESVVAKSTETAETADSIVSKPALAMANKSAAKGDSLDLNKPVTELMQQLQAKTAQLVRPETAKDNASRIEPTMADDSPTNQKSAVAAPPEAELKADVTDKAPNQKTAAKHGASVSAEQPKKKAKKSAFSRLREEIQISFFDDLEIAQESPIPAKGKSPPAKSKPSLKESIAKTLRSDKASKARTEPLEDVVEQPAEVVEEKAPYLVINVTAKETLPGSLLFKLAEACGMEWVNEHDIYQRFEDGMSKGAVQFSLVNATQTGSFEIDDLQTYRTPSVNFFLDMSEPRDLMNAFDCMLATAQCLADNLDAVMRDGGRSTLRPQTIEHYRQQISDFERRRLARRA